MAERTTPSAAATASPPSEKVPLISKLAFGAGDVGPAIATAIMGFFLLFFLTNVAGLSPGLAGSILLAVKGWDAVNDPIVGFLSDRVRTRWGRRRPWFLFGAVPFGLFFFLLWIVPGESAGANAWYYFVVLLLLDTAFSVVNVPYTALTPEMTSDYDERTSLNSYRFAFSITAGLIAAVLHQPIVDAFKPDLRAGYMASAGIWAVAATLPFFFAFWGTYERNDAPTAAVLGFWEGLGVTLRNRAFRYAVVIYLLSWLVVQTVQVLIIYYTNFWLRNPGLTALVILCVQGSALVWLFVWSKLSQRWGKQGVYYRGMAVWIAVSLLLFAVQPDWPDWAVLLLGALAGVGVATAFLIPWSLLPDVVELDELETGQRREGAFYGFFVFLQKLGVGLGIFLVGQVLEWSGYVAPPDGVDPATVAQPESALTAIRWMIGPIPALVLLAGIVAVRLFPITREGHERTLRELEARRAARQ
ncbi:MAG TPA: MFS transporter [Herpetosiphonaceae bacterium]|nr:MFS transporter [Herpetosiphonaceae bacterium]